MAKGINEIKSEDIAGLKEDIAEIKSDIAELK
jgi:hypothetical protein